jgi:CBS domain-containing protein
MLRLNEIMTRDVVTVPAEMSVRDAMSLLATRHITGAPVVSQGKVVGVVSLTDLAEFAAASPGAPTERPETQSEWGEWDEDATADMPEGNEPPSAFFSDLWDDAGAEVSERIRVTEGPEWSALDQATVSEAMTRQILSLSPTTAVDYAAAFMRNAGIHRVLVMDGDQLLGLVSTSDIAGAVAEHKLDRRVYVFGPAQAGPTR